MDPPLRPANDLGTYLEILLECQSVIGVELGHTASRRRSPPLGTNVVDNTFSTTAINLDVADAKDTSRLSSLADTIASIVTARHGQIAAIAISSVVVEGTSKTHLCFTCNDCVPDKARAHIEDVWEQLRCLGHDLPTGDDLNYSFNALVKTLVAFGWSRWRHYVERPLRDMKAAVAAMKTASLRTRTGRK